MREDFRESSNRQNNKKKTYKLLILIHTCAYKRMKYKLSRYNDQNVIDDMIII